MEINQAISQLVQKISGLFSARRTLPNLVRKRKLRPLRDKKQIVPIVTSHAPSVEDSRQIRMLQKCCFTVSVEVLIRSRPVCSLHEDLNRCIVL